jgi:hypothetical protein
VAIAVGAFVAPFATSLEQMAAGHDPALARGSAASTHTVAAATGSGSGRAAARRQKAAAATTSVTPVQTQQSKRHASRNVPR